MCSNIFACRKYWLTVVSSCLSAWLRYEMTCGSPFIKSSVWNGCRRNGRRREHRSLHCRGERGDGRPEYLLHDLCSRFGTATALRRDPQFAAQLAECAGTLHDARADLGIGDAVADADV